MKLRRPYWILGYCQHKCSECGFVVEDSFPKENFCPSCNADMREPLKRCYYMENHPGQKYCPCGESYGKENGFLYCSHYRALHKQKLAGNWYPCEDIKLKETETIQLSFFDGV